MKICSQKKISKFLVYLLFFNPFAFDCFAKDLKISNFNKKININNEIFKETSNELISEVNLDENKLLKDVIDAIDDSSINQFQNKKKDRDKNIHQEIQKF